jgi:hypothetical protein
MLRRLLDTDPQLGTRLLVVGEQVRDPLRDRLDEPRRGSSASPVPFVCIELGAERFIRGGRAPEATRRALRRYGLA